MTQRDVTADRAARVAERDDEDALFDSWLASLSTREFECILDRLAELETPGHLVASA